MADISAIKLSDNIVVNMRGHINGRAIYIKRRQKEMPNSTISQIQLPNGTTYDIEDETARQIGLTATYTAATFNLALDLQGVEDADNEEF